MNDDFRLPRWVVLWVGLSTLVVIWDALFILFRPASFPGGELGFLWDFAYSIYMKVDLAYADQSNTYIHALATMSLFEACIVSWALFAHRIQKNQLAHLLVLVVTSLTGAKTMLFVLVEAWSGWHSIGHNELIPLLFVWVIPNGLWIAVPGLVVFDTGKRLLKHLNA